MNAALLALLVFVAGFALGAHEHKVVRDAAEAKLIRQGQQQLDAKQQVVDQLTAELKGMKDERAASLAAIRKNVVTYVDRPVYQRDCIDADGLSDINAALSGAPYRSRTAGVVPAAGGAGARGR